MKTFHEAATSHYIRSSQLFHTNLCRAPALFLLSRSDPVGAEKSNRSVHDSWVKMGMKCTWKCWDRSPHVQHYTKHPKEYVAALYEHLDKYGLVSQPEKMRMSDYENQGLQTDQPPQAAPVHEYDADPCVASYSCTGQPSPLLPYLREGDDPTRDATATIVETLV
ncbi:unnamed protein product [Chrysodeixis includens]|uniref:Uncharacterized protein n=1 Tax=Chrysodeixis includens TaxID=689277 RepID=A0A9N8KUZ9_CHRIL|nr:unnamed protein product [Chrysodeixis includens]